MMNRYYKRLCIFKIYFVSKFGGALMGVLGSNYRLLYPLTCGFNSQLQGFVFINFTTSGPRRKYTGLVKRSPMMTPRVWLSSIMCVPNSPSTNRLTKQQGNQVESSNKPTYHLDGSETHGIVTESMFWVTAIGQPRVSK